jgi:sugar O-acyltransferase (sialic acid O-acetyltransferase NeuD family)
MRRLLVVGCGGHAREVAHAWVLGHGEETLAGFLDDARTGRTPEGWPILGPVSSWPGFRDCACIVAIGDPRARRRVVERMLGLGQPEWATVVHPDVSLHATVSVGAGSMILGGVQASVNIRIGRFASVNRLVSLGHDAELYDFASVAPLVSVSGNVRVGAGADVGTSASIRQGLALGPGCAVGMGSVVIRDVEANTMVMCNPARPSRTLEPW